MSPRQPRQHDAAHLEFIRTLPCLLCGDDTTVEAAHVRASDPMIGKINPGMGAKPHDKFTVPLCGKHHRDQHDMNESEFWRLAEIDPVKVALALYAVSPDYEEGLRIAMACRQRCAA